MTGSSAATLSGAPVRALFVDHAPALGGAEHSLLLLFECLDRSQVTPLLACVPGPLQERAEALGVACRPMAMPQVRGHLLGPWRLLGGAVALARLARREAAELLCANTVRASLYAALAARLAGLPLVWYVRDILTPGFYIQAMRRCSAAVVAVSCAAAEPLGVGAVIVPNGVLGDAFSTDAARVLQARARWGVPRDAPLVGMVGRLRPWKGQEHFLRAMALVAAQQPDAWFVLVGGAIFEEREPFLPSLRHLADSLELGDRTVFAGQVEDVAAAYAAMDVVVHCSVEPEPFGRVVIEAMAASRPVVAYDWGGPHEIMVPGETGLLVPPGDIGHLSAAVLSLLRDPEKRQAMGAAGRARAAGHYDARATARQVQDLLVEVGRGAGRRL